MSEPKKGKTEAMMLRIKSEGNYETEKMIERIKTGDVKKRDYDRKKKKRQKKVTPERKEGGRSAGR